MAEVVPATLLFTIVNLFSCDGFVDGELLSASAEYREIRSREPMLPLAGQYGKRFPR